MRALEAPERHNNGGYDIADDGVSIARRDHGGGGGQVKVSRSDSRFFSAKEYRTGWSKALNILVKMFLSAQSTCI
jgi:hypothetical protein